MYMCFLYFSLLVLGDVPINVFESLNPNEFLVSDDEFSSYQGGRGCISEVQWWENNPQEQNETLYVGCK